MSEAIISIRDFCDAQARRERARYEEEMASYPWERITVHYNDFFRRWVVTGINNPKHHSFDGTRREGLGDFKYKREAMEEAQLYAFSTDQEGAPARAPVVDIFRKDGVWIDSIHKPIAPKGLPY